MIDWFRQLEPREQLVLGVGALLAVVVVGWNFVWRPLDARSAELADEVAEMSRLLVDLRRAAGLSGDGARTVSGTSDSALLSLIPETASRFGLSLDRNQLEGADAMRVSFNGVPFDALNNWLTELELSHGISVDTVSSISATGTPGLVRGQILLTRPSS